MGLEENFDWMNIQREVKRNETWHEKAVSFKNDCRGTERRFWTVLADLVLRRQMKNRGRR